MCKCQTVEIIKNKFMHKILLHTLSYEVKRFFLMNTRIVIPFKLKCSRPVIAIYDWGRSC